MNIFTVSADRGVLLNMVSQSATNGHKWMERLKIVSPHPSRIFIIISVVVKAVAAEANFGIAH